MSRIFYDHLIVLEDIDQEIKKVAQNEEERHELWQLMDEIIHPRVLACVLENLPRKHHEEFLEKFYKTPHETKLMDYLKEKVGKDIEGILKLEIEQISCEILSEIKTSKKKYP